MGQPTTVAGYEPEWAILADALSRQTNITLPVSDKKAAFKLRFRFYGFRKALMKHDPTNPWIAALMETQATVTPEGNLHFERAPYAVVLRGLLEHSVMKAPQAPAAQSHESENAEPPQSNLDATILNVLTGNKP